MAVWHVRRALSLLTDDTPYQQTYQTLEEFVDQGFTKNIGVRYVELIPSKNDR